MQLRKNIIHFYISQTQLGPSTRFIPPSPSSPFPFQTTPTGQVYLRDLGFQRCFGGWLQAQNPVGIGAQDHLSERRVASWITTWKSGKWICHWNHRSMFQYGMSGLVEVVISPNFIVDTCRIVEPWKKMRLQQLKPKWIHFTNTNSFQSSYHLHWFSYLFCSVPMLRRSQRHFVLSVVYWLVLRMGRNCENSLGMERYLGTSTFHLEKKENHLLKRSGCCWGDVLTTREDSYLHFEC